ncbi:MAG: MBL fold metallo-hydrolase, partial [Sinomicrobium sp.]|nr:MBL fold metallo-hydrolase [Sinomicrobium sp.]
MKYTVNQIIIAVLFLIFYSCKNTAGDTASLTDSTVTALPDKPFLIVLGTVQDAGSPHIACKKDCCRELFQNPDKTRKVVALGLVDPESKKCYLMEATPDLPEQLSILNACAPFNEKQVPDGIFLTHAHIGHYSGLMYLGKEGVDTGGVPVYAMPKMKSFLERNGPWDQLVTRNNIVIREITHNKGIKLTSNLQITPFTVPHRDEYSETAGYIISGPDKKVLFIPDIDKWEKWETSVTEAIETVDYAYIDGTFFDAADISHRDVSQIPHPFITESMALFGTWPESEKSKIRFIHLN